MSVESTIYYCPRVFVFDLRNVPNNNGLGYKAIDFTKNPHMWAGQLRINSGQTAEGEDANTVVLEHDPSDPAGKSGVFARCEAKPEAIMAALDSSRYFVLRIYNQTGQFVQIAVGFNNKNDAFDFRHELSVLTQKKQQLTTLLPQGEGQDLTLKTNISLDINNLRPNNNQQPSDAQRSQFVSRPTNVEKVSLNAQQHQVRGRNRTGGMNTTTSQQNNLINQPQQQEQQPQQQQPQQPQQQQNKTADPFDFADFGKALSQTTAPQQQQQPTNNHNNNVDIFSTLAPPSQPQQQIVSPQQQHQQQQQSAASGGLLDNFFSSDHTVKQSVTRENNAAPQQQTKPTPTAGTQKKADLFDFDDNDFNF